MNLPASWRLRRPSKNAGTKPGTVSFCLNGGEPVRDYGWGDEGVAHIPMRKSRFSRKNTDRCAQADAIEQIRTETLFSVREGSQEEGFQEFLCVAKL